MKDNSFKTIIVDDRKHYMVIPNCPIRLVFEDNEYVGWYYAGDDAVEMLKNEEIRENPRKSEWIPVSERLPEEWTAVLVLSEFGFCEVAVYLGSSLNKWRVTWDHDMLDGDVTHWMPLPEPPKEAEK